MLLSWTKSGKYRSDWPLAILFFLPLFSWSFHACHWSIHLFNIVFFEWLWFGFLVWSIRQRRVATESRMIAVKRWRHPDRVGVPSPCRPKPPTDLSCARKGTSATQAKWSLEVEYRPSPVRNVKLLWFIFGVTALLADDCLISVNRIVASQVERVSIQAKTGHVSCGKNDMPHHFSAINYSWSELRKNIRGKRWFIVSHWTRHNNVEKWKGKKKATHQQEHHVIVKWQVEYFNFPKNLAEIVEADWAIVVRHCLLVFMRYFRAYQCFIHIWGVLVSLLYIIWSGATPWK